MKNNGRLKLVKKVGLYTYFCENAEGTGLCHLIKECEEKNKEHKYCHYYSYRINFIAHSSPCKMISFNKDNEIKFINYKHINNIIDNEPHGH